MTRFRQLLDAHGPLLLVDAASTRVQVGFFDDGQARWQTSIDEAGVGIFRSIEALDVDLSAVRAFAFCEGPGSVLGVRTTAMALRTWCTLATRPVFAYCSLALVSHALARPEVSVIADARRDRWHRYQLGKGLDRVAAADLTGSLAMPEGFRHWSPLPANVSITPYLLADLLPRVADLDLFGESATPDAFLHEEPSYVTWTPQIHRAPARSS